MKTLTIGILAHVDAGKTTLSEAMLYRAGMLRAMGRVDHGDAFLDTDAQERERGITIFSKQAVLDLPDCRFILLDFIELSDQYGIAELTLPEAWVGKTIRELNIRAKYGVNIIAVRENGKINVVPDADEPLPEGCVLVAVGANDKLTRLRG